MKKESMRQVVRVLARHIPCSYRSAWEIYMTDKQKRGLTVYDDGKG